MTIAYDNKATGGEKSSAPLFAHRVELVFTTETYTTATGGIVVDLVGEIDELANKTIKAVLHLLGPGTTTTLIAEYQHATTSLRIYESSADGNPLDEVSDGAFTGTFQLLVIAV